MKPLITLILTIFILAGCQKEQIQICDDPNCETYLEIWENVFKSRNNMPDDYFRDHIKVSNAEISPWLDGESFRVSYTIQKDWAEIESNDQFIIKIAQNAPPYPSLTVSRTDYLNESEINEVLDQLAFSSHMTTIDVGSKLIFNSKSQAMNALQTIADTRRLKFQKLYLKAQTMVFNANGHPFLKGHGTLNYQANRCIAGEIDLVTGEADVHVDVCRFH